jgi:hypothetical protein
MLTIKPSRSDRPRRAAWLVALTVLATGLVVAPAMPAAAAGLNVTITPQYAGDPGKSALWSAQSITVTGSLTVVNNGRHETVSIIDQTTGQTIRSCDGQLVSGTLSCSVVVVQTGATTHVYYAAASELIFNVGYRTGQSYSVPVTWDYEQVLLQKTPLGSPSTVATGTAVTLTATSYLDVGPSPYYLEIFDLTAGTRIGFCGVGFTCSATVTENAATTHVFRAYVTPSTLTPPVDGRYWLSADSYVTWNDGINTVFFNFTETHYLGLNATAPAIPQGYVIEIFDENSGQPVVSCAMSPCEFDYPDGDPHAGVFDGYVAFIAPPDDTTLPPASFLASSNTGQTGYPAPPL